MGHAAMGKTMVMVLVGIVRPSGMANQTVFPGTGKI